MSTRYLPGPCTVNKTMPWRRRAVLVGLITAATVMAACGGPASSVASADPCHAQCAVAERRHVGVRQQPGRLRRGPFLHRAVRLANGSQRRPGSTDQPSRTHRYIGQSPIGRFPRRRPSRSVRSCQDDGRDSLRSAELEQGGIAGGEARRCLPGRLGGDTVGEAHRATAAVVAARS